MDIYMNLFDNFIAILENDKNIKKPIILAIIMFKVITFIIFIGKKIQNSKYLLWFIHIILSYWNILLTKLWLKIYNFEWIVFQNLCNNKINIQDGKISFLLIRKHEEIRQIFKPKSFFEI